MVSEKEILNQNVRAIIAKGMAYTNMTDADLMERIAVSKSTFERRMKDPSTFTLREAQVLCMVLRLNPIDRCALIKPMSKKEVKDFLLV